MLALLSVALVLATGDQRLPDRVELRDGTLVQGRVVFEDAKSIVVRVGTHDREIAHKDVKSTYYRADNQRGAIERWVELKPEDVRGVLDLAQFCKRSDLLEEMRLCAWWAVLLDHDNEDAHAYLGDTRTKTDWLVREGARHVELDKVLAGHKNWNDAWVLSTTHYNVRTNLPLADGIAAAFTLECHYNAFFGSFAHDLHLLEVVEPLNASIHADSKSFPRLAGARPAYFNPDTLTLEIDASNGIVVSDLTHEATHAVLQATAIATRASRGDIPAWLNEGLAEYMASGFEGKPGRIKFSRDAVNLVHFSNQAKATKPYDLSRVLNFESSDFATNLRADLKYAEAYTLVHYGLLSNGGDLRTKFLAFVRSAYNGQASQSHFEEAMGMSNEKIEQAWTSYVKSVAGK